MRGDVIGQLGSYGQISRDALHHGVRLFLENFYAIPELQAEAHT